MRKSTPQIPAPPPREIAMLDEELHRLARGAGRLRLRIGQALHRLGDGVHELGFSTLGAYALERCCRGGRWAAESRTLARRLQSLPQLTKALETGSIGWSMAELLARHATPQTEAALLQVARGKTVQAMRIALSPQNSPAPPNDDELARTLSLTLPVEEAWALEAEGTAWRSKMQRLQHLHADAELRSRPAVAIEPNAGEASDADDLPHGLDALDARIRHYSAELASRDLFSSATSPFTTSSTAPTAAPTPPTTSRAPAPSATSKASTQVASKSSPAAPPIPTSSRSPTSTPSSTRSTSTTRTLVVA